MQLKHFGTIYECAVAVKCTADKYIKLYDENGAEIASFYNISDFSDFTLEGGSFSAPCAHNLPILLSTYSIGGHTIKKSDWDVKSTGQYFHEITNNLISANTVTCNITLYFASGTRFNYSAMQENGKIVLYVDVIPEKDIVIDNIIITRA